MRKTILATHHAIRPHCQTAGFQQWTLRNQILTDGFNLYKSPLHPYTRALLETLPSIDSTRTERLRSIGGQPPHMAAAPSSCPFAARCGHVHDRCHAENPPLVEVADGHDVACWWRPPEQLPGQEGARHDA